MRVNFRGAPRQRMDRKNVISFAEAMDKRTTARDMTHVRQELIALNYVRWLRMQRDIAWLKKQLVKMGLNPEDWSTYL